MEAKGVPAKTLAKTAELGETYIRDFLKKDDSDIYLGKLNKVANALGVPLSSILPDSDNAHSTELLPVLVGPALNIKGVVAAGQWVEAYEYPEDDWELFMGRPDVNADVAHRFGLRVVGDSMNAVYPEGTIIECVSVFGYTEIEPGKKVVVIRTRNDLSIEATVKEYAVIDDKEWLLPRSTNPTHQAIDIGNPDPDIKEIQIVAVVVSSVRPE